MNEDKEITEDVIVMGASKPKKRKCAQIKTEQIRKEPEDSDIKVTGSQGPTTEGLYKLMQKTIECAKGKLRGQSSGFIVSNQQRQCRHQKE